MDFLKNSFTQSLNYLNPLHEDFFLKDLFNWLNPFSEKFILKQLWSFLTDIVSYINPLSDNFLGKKIVEFIGDLLTKLFVPQEDHFTSLNNRFKSKFGFIDQLSNLLNTLFTDSSQSSSSVETYVKRVPPNWNITFHNTTVSIIDWSAFEEYRGFLHSIINFILWGSFLIRLYKRVPGYINAYYVEGDSGKEK